jgi:hypothetical protein
MSLHIAAKHLASKGRDGDTELVHMTKGEIRGLQGLALAHGGSLSINPDTGLVEASFLKRILPMIAGAGLMLIPGVGPLAAAGMVGGFETLRTGDIGKGLMAGLGAYGGAGLAQGLSAAGGTAAGLESGAGAVGSDAATMGTTEGMTRALTADTGVGSSMGINSFDAANLGQTPLDPTKVTNFADAYSKGAAPSLTNMGRGIGQLGSEVGRSAVYSGMPTGTLPALGSTVAGALTPEAPPIPGQPEEDPRYAGSPYRYNLAPGFSGSTPVRPNPYYRPTGLGYAEGGDVMEAARGAYIDEPMGDVAGMASGGIAGYAAGGLKMGQGIARDTDSDTASLNAFDAAKKRMAKINKAANMPKNYESKMPQVRGLGELAMAQGGSLGSYSDGGRMLKGPGDGMSDDIPAVIGRKQPARLADGEFVVPADVVSHLGNGSTDAGAKKLYGMMDKVRTARTGKKKQAPAVKADKYMPA